MIYSITVEKQAILDVILSLHMFIPIMRDLGKRDRSHFRTLESVGECDAETV